MTTFFDFVSVGIFIGLAILYLHRSSRPEPDPVALWAYGLAALGCAAGNVIGDAGHVVIGAALLAGSAMFVVKLLMLSLRRR